MVASLLTLLALGWLLALLGCAAYTRLELQFYLTTLVRLHKMWRAGCFRGRLAALHRLQLRDCECRQPPELGGHSLARVEAVSLDVSLWQLLLGRPYTLACKGLWLSWDGDSSGQSHLVALLAHFGFLREVGGKGRPKEPEGWVRVDKEAGESVEQPLSGTLRAWRGQVVLQGGRVSMSRDLGLVVGGDIVLEGLIGRSSLEAHGSEGLREWAAELEAAPTDFDGGVARYPVAARVTSANLALQLRGWRTPQGLRLAAPLATRFTLSPDLVRHGLGRLSPLLATAVASRGGTLEATLTPLALHLPAERYTLRCEPMQLALAPQGLLPKITRLLQMRGAESGEEEPLQSGARGELQAATSALEAVIHTDGSVETRRFDMRLGRGQTAGVHVAIWGRMTGSALDMTLGLPGRPLGLRQPGAFFTVPVRGTPEKPSIDVLRAGKQLAGLLVQERVTRDMPLLGGLLGGLRSPKRGAAAGPEGEAAPAEAVPPPISPLPWVVEEAEKE